MHILICSDGTEAADQLARLGALIASPCGASVTLLGVAEQPADEAPLRAALEREAAHLRQTGIAPELKVSAGDPVAQILQEVCGVSYDLVLVGSRRKGTRGSFWRPQRAYEIIRTIPPPVLAVGDRCERLSKFLVCTGGKHYIETAVKLTGEIAACAGASVTLLHVMAEPPLIYADLMRLEEDVDALLAAGSELGRNLRAQKEGLEKLGVQAEVRVRHGSVLEQVFAEVREGGHDMIVTGSSRARGALQHYIMGDVTRSILDRAKCPVLVARPPQQADTGFLARLKRMFS